MDISTMHNARLVLERLRSDIAEARGFGLMPLAEMLESRLAECVDSAKRCEQLTPDVELALAALRAAEAEQTRSQRARDFGAAERKEACRLVDDHEHAKQVVAVRTREHQALFSTVSTAFTDINKFLFDRAREAAEANARSLALQCLRGREQIEMPDVHVTAAVAIWEPYFEAKELAAYATNAKSPEFAKARARPRTEAQLRSLFASRHAQRRARVAQLEGALQSARAAAT